MWGMVFLLALGAVAKAHPLDLGRLDLQSEKGDLILTLDLNPLQAVLLMGIPLAEIDKGRTASNLGVSLLQDNQLCQSPDRPTVTHTPEQLRLTWRVRCPAPSGSRYELSLPFLAAASPTLELVGQAHFPDGEHPFTLSPARTSVAIESRSGWALGRFIGMGIRHIGAAPGEWWGPRGLQLPEGIDHILFVVALVLGGGRLRQVLVTVTGFTLGHSVTLALAATNILRVPGAWVEPAIALSIVYVAVEDLIRTRGRSRWWVACAFGLVHGLGFASALRDLGLRGGSLAQALVGFNVGVELGQAAIVLALTPLLLWLGREGRVERIARRALAAPIIAVASYWFVQRVAVLF